MWPQNENRVLQYRFRPSRIEDCFEIARLYRISSDGVADYIWTKISEPGEDILDIGCRRYQREDSVYSYKNCTVVEIGGKIIGMLAAFPMYVDSTHEEYDPVLQPYSKLEEDNSYYICGMALFPRHRGFGIGTRLLRFAEEQAQAQGFEKLSLIVFEQNSAAMRLYEKTGYRERMRAAVVSHPLIRCGGDAILMVKNMKQYSR